MAEFLTLRQASRLSGRSPYAILSAATRGEVRTQLPPGRPTLFHAGDCMKLVSTGQGKRRKTADATV